MENFRDFQIGPDPFGRNWQVLFKYLQTGISIRNSDSVDVCFVLNDGSAAVERIVVFSNADLRDFAKRSGREISDTWCSRMAVCKLRQAILSAEDLDNMYLQATPTDIAEFDADIRKFEDQWLRDHAA